MKICKKCGKGFPKILEINGRKVKSSGRSFCLECSPYRAKNILKICEQCGNGFRLKVEIDGAMRDISWRKICLECLPLQAKTIKMNICLSCGEKFPCKIEINGEIKSIYNRHYCLECSPYGKQNHIRFSEQNKYPSELTDTQEQILNGHLLGDGNLSKVKNKGNSTFTVVRCAEDIEYLEWTAKHFNIFSSDNMMYDRSYFDTRTNKIYYTYSFHTRQLPVFTKYYHKWYPEGKKIVPSNLILTPLTIAVWFADDGNIRNDSSGAITIKFSTQGFIRTDVEFLHSQLVNLYGEKVRIQKADKENQLTIQISHTPTSKELIRDIYDVFPPLLRKSDIWNRPLVDLWDKHKIINPNCIWCGSDKNRRNGYDTKYYKKQKYLCANCGRNYYDISDYEILSKRLHYNSNPPSDPLLNAAEL